MYTYVRNFVLPSTVSAAYFATIFAAYSASQLDTTTCQTDLKPDNNDKPSNNSNTANPKLLFLGTGSSTGCPRPLCSLLFPPTTHHASPLTPHQQQMKQSCTTSRLATIGNPRFNKNYRNNPSLLISHQNNDDGKHPPNIQRNVVIDVGKTFREASIRFMPHHGIRSLDAIVLTHEHMDAIGGLDDVRGFQRYPKKLNDVSKEHYSTPVFLSRKCYEQVKRQFHYLVPELQHKNNSSNVIRAVASLDFRIIDDFQPLYAAGLKLVPLPILHGEDFISHGFGVSIRNPQTSRSTNLIYLSDISRMPMDTFQYIHDNFPSIDILIVDSLLMHRKHSVHFNLREAMDLAKTLKAKKVYIVGMNCDDFLDHERMNKILKHDVDLDVELAYDGLVLEL